MPPFLVGYKLHFGGKYCVILNNSFLYGNWDNLTPLFKEIQKKDKSGAGGNRTHVHHDSKVTSSTGME